MREVTILKQLPRPVILLRGHSGLRRVEEGEIGSYEEARLHENSLCLR